MGKVVCPWNLITDFVIDAFVGYGVPREDAEVVADILLESDKRGIESHGCNRFKPIYIDRIVAGIQEPVTNFEIVKETETTAVVDGHNGMGQVIGKRAMQKSKALNGLDSLLSIVQMPSGIPVATMAIDGSKNAALYAVSILALSDSALSQKLQQFREEQSQKVLNTII